MGLHRQDVYKFPVQQESGETPSRGASLALMPLIIPLGPEIRCPHYQPQFHCRTYVCRECAGVLLTRSTIHRLRPLLTGNGAENFAELRFQPHLIPHPTESHNPHQLHTWLRHKASVLEIGAVGAMSVESPNVVVRPDHKCIHGVSWGTDNCRACREVVYAGKKARLIWEAIQSRNIRPVIRSENGNLFTLDGSADPNAGFVLVVKSEIDAALGITDVVSPKDLQRYRDIISAATKNTCIECGATIDPDLNYCQACASRVVMEWANVPEAENVETWGDNAAFSETKSRPLSNRNIDFSFVRLVARTFICGVLSDATAKEISSLDDDVFMELCQWCPPMMTLLRRFYLWTHGVPLADIASLEGVGRKAIERYFQRWRRIIEGVINPLS